MASQELLCVESNINEDLLQIRLDGLRESLTLAQAQDQELNIWQQATLVSLVNNLEQAQSVDLPTRSGKSHLIRVIAKAVESTGGRTLIASHRRHILDEHINQLTNAGTAVEPLNPGQTLEPEVSVFTTSFQSIARQRDRRTTKTTAMDVVLIDEAHRAIGEKTLEGMRSLFPNAVFIAFSATPDYGENRSITDEYGEKVISKSIVEAIQLGLVPPVRAFLYKSDGYIDYMDPSYKDFTPRELRRLASLLSRNLAIVDTVSDLVQRGRQGLVTTIPGENLMHANLLKKSFDERSITDSDGNQRKIRSAVVRGSDTDKQSYIDAFENGEIDVLLYCDVLREGLTSNVASFLVNGRPTTSIVNLTQDIGRVLQPKELEAIIVDFLDDSIKAQRTVYDVLELDRSIQGVYVGNRTAATPGSETPPETYLRGLFRQSLMDGFLKINDRLIADLHYSQLTQKDPLTIFREAQETERRREENRLQKKWDRVLANEGLAADQPDNFTASENTLKKSSRSTPEGDGVYRVELGSFWYRRTWDGFLYHDVVLPAVPISDEKIAAVLDDPNDLRADKLEPSAEDSYSDSEKVLRVIMSSIIRKTRLEERDESIIAMHSGLDGDVPKTFDQIGALWDVSRANANQREAYGLSRLREIAYRIIEDIPDTTYDYGISEATTADLIRLDPLEFARKAQGVLSAVGVEETPAKPTVTSKEKPLPQPKDRIELNRRIMKQKDAYLNELDELFDTEPGGHYNRHVSEELIKDLFESFNLSNGNYVLKSRLISTLTKLKHSWFGDKPVESGITPYARLLGRKPVWLSLYKMNNPEATDEDWKAEVDEYRAKREAILAHLRQRVLSHLERPAESPNIDTN